MNESETPATNEDIDNEIQSFDTSGITDADIATELERLRETLGPWPKPEPPQPPTEEQIAVVARMQARRAATHAIFRRAQARQTQPVSISERELG